MGHMEALGFPFRQEAILQTLIADVLNSSDIEGEKLDAAASNDFSFSRLITN